MFYNFLILINKIIESLIVLASSKLGSFPYKTTSMLNFWKLINST